MFSFHKSDAPSLSGRSFEESSVSNPSNATSLSDSWNSHLAEDSTHGAFQPFEQTSKPHASKRGSVFALRSRSNTATSLTYPSAALSPPLGMANHFMSLPSSPLPAGQHGSQILGEAPGSRMSIFRGKKEKRLSESHPSIVSAKGFQEPDMSGKRASVLRKARRRNSPPEELPSFQALKDRISSPFDFQHLTHADRHQFAALEQASSDLAAGFKAVRASQQPSRQLTGIKANDLHGQNFPLDPSSMLNQQPNSAMEFSSSSDQHPALGVEWQQASPPSQDSNLQPSLRLSRSAESFSQPGVKLGNHRHSQSTMGLLLSPYPLGHADDGSEGPIDMGRKGASVRSRSKRDSGVWDPFRLGTGTTESSQSSCQRDDSTHVGHALTTPDDLAIQAMTPPFTPGLEDVAEEPEMFVRPRAAPEPPIKSPTILRSPHIDSCFNGQRSPRYRMMRDRGNSYFMAKPTNTNTIQSRPMSQMSDTLGSSSLVRRGSILRPSASRRKSNTWRAPEESWEDDVDYIYDNALEAECDFEWDHSFVDDTINRTRAGSVQESPKGTMDESKNLVVLPPDSESEPKDGCYVDFRASLLMPSTGSMPDLEPTSATSLLTMDTALPTPMDPYTMVTRGTGGLVSGPSLLLSREYKEPDEVTYEDLLDQYGDHSEPHFTMIGPGHSATSSARSSRIRSSRRSSYDSSLISSTQNSGLWSSPFHRSASSAGSIPELVPSQRARRDLGFSIINDQLSDSVASLRDLDEEKEESEDNATPPGHMLYSQRFFPANEESQTDATCNDVPEGELLISLEPAQRGSQRSERHYIDRGLKPSSIEKGSHHLERHRRQALSDGATKLLMNADTSQEDALTKSRNRAATASQVVRPPMLSLFPTPPKKIQTPNHA